MITVNATIHVHLADTREVAEIHAKLDQILERQEKLMADLTNEFTAFATEQGRLLGEVDVQIQQLADAFAQGNLNAQTIEDARVKITAATTAAKDAADRLAADNPATPEPPPEG